MNKTSDILHEEQWPLRSTSSSNTWPATISVVPRIDASLQRHLVPMHALSAVLRAVRIFLFSPYQTPNDPTMNWKTAPRCWYFSILIVCRHSIASSSSMDTATSMTVRGLVVVTCKSGLRPDSGIVGVSVCSWPISLMLSFKILWTTSCS